MRSLSCPRNSSYPSGRRWLARTSGRLALGLGPRFLAIVLLLDRRVVRCVLPGIAGSQPVVTCGRLRCGECSTRKSRPKTDSCRRPGPPDSPHPLDSQATNIVRVAELVYDKY